MKMQGVKSKEFGAFWKSMFLVALGYPSKFNPKDENHVEVKKRVSAYLNSVKYALPCKFCREYTQNVIQKKVPLNYKGRRELMYSLYLWKDLVNKKLISQGDPDTKPSPDFEVVYNHYCQFKAKCDKSIGKCI